MLSFFHNYLLFMTLHLCVVVLLYATRVRRISVMATRTFDEYALNVEFTI